MLFVRSCHDSDAFVAVLLHDTKSCQLLTVVPSEQVCASLLDRLLRASLLEPATSATAIRLQPKPDAGKVDGKRVHAALMSL